MSTPLSVAFVWHMHQPYYKRSRHGSFEMPWVRLHALKDYLDMVELTLSYPSLHQTFNLVPSLVEQLEDYARGDFTDLYWELTLKPAADLDSGERESVVDLMCERAGHPRAQRYPRYLELSRKGEACLSQGIDLCAAAFSVDELRDLQVWSTLSWFDPIHLRDSPLADLVSRGRDFTESDKQTLAAAQADILVRVVPAYRRAEAGGHVELTTSPYFHPILPLLINTDLSRISRVDAPLPPRRFAHPEDAREQIRLAMEHHTATFGRPPRGMWCSELGVGEDVVPLLTEAGLAWTIADEGILGRSLGQDIARTDRGRVHEPDRLYHPYRLEREGRSLDIVFRDRVLSDLIGFTYRSWAPQDAAADLVRRLAEVNEGASGDREPRLVTIALDGENAWEYYQNDGHEFLSRLYESLVAEPGFRCVSVGEFLAENPPQRELPWLHTGSWVFADFSTWIGDPAHGPAWDLLHRARDRVTACREAAEAEAAPTMPGDGAATALHPAAPADGGTAAPGGGGAAASARAAAARPSVADLDEAWHHILVAEGSDWFWWFSAHQESGADYLWDLAFRGHLQEAYRCLGESPPTDLFAPLLPRDGARESAPPKDRFTPIIDGRISSPDEWAHAGFRRAPQAGAMQTSQARILDEVQFGRDQENLYLLLIPGRGGFPAGTRMKVSLALLACTDGAAEPVCAYEPSHELALEVNGPGSVDAKIAALPSHEVGAEAPSSEEASSPEPHAVFDTVVEVALPLARLRMQKEGALSGGDPSGRHAPRLSFSIAAFRDETLMELLPAQGSIDLDLS